jgi:hypothetical protein
MMENMLAELGIPFPVIGDPDETTMPTPTEAL